MEIYSELKPHFEKLKIDENHIEYFYDFYRENLRKYPDLTKEVLNEALFICREKNYESGSAWCLLSLGWYYQDRCLYDEAIDLQSRAHDIFLEKNNKRGIARTSNALLAVYTAIGMFDLAIEYGLTGIHVSEKYNDEEAFIPLIINTSMAYLESKYYKECIDLVKRLDSIWDKIEPQNRTIIYNMLAEVELHFDNVENAYNYCNKANELIKEHNLVVIENDNLLVRAEINWKVGNYDNAEHDYQNALNLSIKYSNVSMMLKILISWSRYHSSINNYKGAEEKLLKAIKEGRKIGSKLSMKEIYYQLSILYEKTERYKDAYEALKVLSEYEKDIFNHNSSFWFAKLHNKKVIEEAKIYKVLYDEMKIISKIGKKITSNLNKESTLEAIYNEVNLLVNADIFGIALYDEDKKNLNYELFMERGEKKNYGLISVEEEDSFGAYCFNNKTDVLINDIYTEYKTYIKRELNKKDENKEVANSAIFCSLIIDDNVIGILSVQNYEKNAYNNNDLNKLKILASYIAIALQNAKLYEEVEFLATHDSLTGVLNRREILNIGKLNSVEHVMKETSTGIILLDIDHFKQVNDNYGHIVGDYVLKKVVDTMRLQVRSKDYVGRYGGEEFLILLPETGFEEIKKIGERIRKSIEESKYEIDEINKINITCSLGVYEYGNGDKVTFEQAIKFADEALYSAKSLGRNKVVEYIKNN